MPRSFKTLAIRGKRLHGVANAVGKLVRYLTPSHGLLLLGVLPRVIVRSSGALYMGSWGDLAKRVTVSPIFLF